MCTREGCVQERDVYRREVYSGGSGWLIYCWAMMVDKGILRWTESRFAVLTHFIRMLLVRRRI
jgi:hypothetical protein